MNVPRSCQICTGLKTPYHVTAVLGLSAGAFAGCQGCFLLTSALGAFPEVSSAASFLLLSQARTLYVRLFDYDAKPLGIIELYTDPGKPCALPLIGPGRQVSSEPWNARTVQLARSRLDICLKRHPICRKNQTSELPTRVIDVGSNDSEVRLYITNGEQVPYVALSHCWGGQKPTETTSRTLSPNIKHIEFDDNSKTFSDAARVTRELGLKYLWIDSLCIIQDDKVDWATEAGKMSEVYRNAAITISAEGAKSTADGLFNTADIRASLQREKVFECKSSAGEDMPVHARQRTSSCFDSSSRSHASVPTASTELSNRAWVVQERLLSPRMLHFFHEELAWSCRSVSCCECRFDPGTADPSVFKNLSDDAALKLRTEYDLQREWAALVTNFSRKRLTYATDRLPAISGLAGLVGKYTKSKYLAGLWEFDVPYGLLWMSDHERAGPRAIKRFDSTVAVPSWSWGSVIGPIVYMERHRTQFEHRTRRAEVKPLLEFVSASTELKGPNPYGEVRSGTIAVRGQYLPVLYDKIRKVWRPGSSRKSSATSSRGANGYNLDAVLTRMENLSLNYPEPTIEPKVTIDVLNEHPDAMEDAELERTDYLFLRAGIYIFGGIFASNAQENVCLLIKRSQSTHPRPGKLREYQRAGLVLHGFHTDHVWARQPKALFHLV